jgi:Domain of unknown function (DUF4249)
MMVMSACIKEIDASFLNAPEQVAVECFISPTDSIIEAKVVRVLSFVSKEIIYENLFIKDAKLLISNGLIEKKFQYNSTKKSYECKISADFKIEKGKKYYLNLSTIDGKKLSSSCTVPAKRFEKNEIIIENSKRGLDLIDIRYKWQSSQSELYGIRPFYYLIFDNKEMPISTKNQYFKGSEFSDNQAISKYVTNDLTVGTKKNTVFFYVMDENYFNYDKSVQLNNNNQDDPFSQPINVKSNIVGGFGCFGAYNVTRIDYEL